jgi:hypothetical protein
MSDFVNALKEVGAFFNRVSTGIDEIPKRMKHFKYGFENAFAGIKHEFVNLGHSFKLGGDDIGRLLQMVIELIYNSIRCGYYGMSNLRCCFVFYIASFLGKLLYLIVPLTVYILRTFTGIDLRERVKSMHKSLETTDEMLYDVIGFHFIRFPDSVRKKCFTCPGNFTLSGSIGGIKQQSEDINYDFNHTIPEWLNEPARDFRQAKNEFKQVFGKADYSKESSLEKTKSTVRRKINDVKNEVNNIGR